MDAHDVLLVHKLILKGYTTQLLYYILYMIILDIIYITNILYNSYVNIIYNIIYVYYIL